MSTNERYVPGFFDRLAASARELLGYEAGSAGNPIPLAPMTVTVPSKYPEPQFVNEYPGMPTEKEARALVQSRFVRDTLMPLVARDDRPPLVNALGFHPNPSAGGYYTPNASPDTVVMTAAGMRSNEPHSPRYIMSHEYGHAFDNRRMNPKLVQDVEGYYDNYVAGQKYGYAPHRGPYDQYATASKAEFFADQFARAVGMLTRPVDDAWRRDFSDIAQTRPEVLTAMRGLVRTPVFHRHPAASIILGNGGDPANPISIGSRRP